MTSTTYSDGSRSGEPLAVGLGLQDAAASASQRWRSAWRIHFYAGMFAMPFILFMAVTGLVILYTQPIQDAFGGDLRTVADQGEWVSFDDQEQAVETAYPDMAVISMTVPPDSEHSTIFGLDDGSAAGQQAFVDPYTAEVLGARGHRKRDHPLGQPAARIAQQRLGDGQPPHRRGLLGRGTGHARLRRG